MAFFICSVIQIYTTKRSKVKMVDIHVANNHSPITAQFAKLMAQDGATCKWSQLRILARAVVEL
jgi:hypothetical protein